MTVQTSGESRGLDRIRLTAITQRGRFGNGAPPAFFRKKPDKCPPVARKKQSRWKSLRDRMGVVVSPNRDNETQNCPRTFFLHPQRTAL